jgi:hypothetical protein
MALIATNENNPVELRARMFVELAQYVAPKRKAVEHSGDGAMLEALLLKLDAEHVDGAATRWLPADLGFKLFGISLKIAGRLIATKNCGVVSGTPSRQALAMHSASMECSRRAMIREQPFEVAQGFRKAATSSSRTFIEPTRSGGDRHRAAAGCNRTIWSATLARAMPFSLSTTIKEVTHVQSSGDVAVRSGAAVVHRQRCCTGMVEPEAGG